MSFVLKTRLFVWAQLKKSQTSIDPSGKIVPFDRMFFCFSKSVLRRLKFLCHQRTHQRLASLLIDYSAVLHPTSMVFARNVSSSICAKLSYSLFHHPHIFSTEETLINIKDLPWSTATLFQLLNRKLLPEWCHMWHTNMAEKKGRGCWKVAFS